MSKKYPKVEKEIFDKEIKSTPIDELFTLEKTSPVCFFYRLPEMVRTQYEIEYGLMLSDSDLQWIYRVKNNMDKYMKDICVDKFRNQILKYADDCDYFNFYEYFEILQPTIETIINGYNLYEEYPEYLI